MPCVPELFLVISTTYITIASLAIFVLLQSNERGRTSESVIRYRQAMNLSKKEMPA